MGPKNSAAQRELPPRWVRTKRCVSSARSGFPWSNFSPQARQASSPIVISPRHSIATVGNGAERIAGNSAGGAPQAMTVDARQASKTRVAMFTSTPSPDNSTAHQLLETMVTLPRAVNPWKTALLERTTQVSSRISHRPRTGALSRSRVGMETQPGAALAYGDEVYRAERAEHRPRSTLPQGRHGLLVRRPAHGPPRSGPAAHAA